MTFEFHPEAEEEFLKAISYYEDCGPKLGEEFSLEVFSAAQNILSYPYSWPVLEDDIRRCLINRFPYSILYSVDPDRIYILAVMHLHRCPDYWKHRSQTVGPML
jgi:toxin ParE1/3/4